ncbi:aldehyde dehydrogenase [Sphaerisporangium krabiense]|uniref:5-carboxymethyl-2-hydroxymuconic-semialdehyde dehydrogenase n=1 Tax=Sphaerisporangium krabiense TaxID=763782 RepID=A0A7W9DR83_9ACTN|nr:5-carboxymethyl-2-hydroxymuconate semialdehyde dehydrogenase [Sphaerisporangium krabiense]MBB5628372.1 5-carboxymethyl-2-hydroxymuconic-semialdehyde dehydrogenase [Sphaerisporangium krabiense]GII66888.1 aldehyde dehydrogenase [Sphaerisporangium krabiense]
MNLEHYIGGAHVPSVTGATFTALEPATNKPYLTVSAGGPEDIAAAVAAARTAFTEGPWPKMTGEQRAAVLRRIAAAIESRDDEIAARECRDTGLPITQARGQAHRAAHNFRFFADVITTLGEEVYRVASAQLNYVLRKPVGVAGLITPWNTPFMLETWKLAPALAAGCPVVLKPAEWSPASAGLLPEIMEEAGLPTGVFNLVHGIGEDAGAALVAHPDVPVISFTGETTTGQIIMRNAADNLKALSMELGGKSPLLVFADADLDRALDAAVFGVFSLNGERCTASSRVLVQEEVYDEFVERLAARASRVKVGAPSDPATELGALIHPEHYERVMEYVRIGTEEGARLVAGGERPAHLPEGNFLGATVFADVTPKMRIFQEEIFGPVVSVTPFSTEAEALELANATRYGLAAYLWTNDLRRTHRLAQSIEAGMMWVNSQNVRDLRTPFGGVKASGLGREGGHHSIDVYTEAHIVHLATEDLPIPRFGAA